MVGIRYRLALLATAGVAVLFVVTGRSQTTRMAASSTRTAPATSGSAVKMVPQPAEFLALAAKAKKLKNVYVKGVVILEGDEQNKIPLKLRTIEFEVWAAPPKTRTKVDSPDCQQCVSDGKFSYMIRGEGKDRMTGRRTRITPGNMYHTLMVAAIFSDAAAGYANLAAAVKFVPTSVESKYAAKLGKIKWFQLKPVTKPSHLLLNGWTTTIGISTTDGLARILIGRKTVNENKIILNYVFKTVRHGAVKDKDLKLPAAAAKANWTDADTGKSIPAPRKVIAKPES